MNSVESMDIIQALWGGTEGQEKNEDDKQFCHVGQEGIPPCTGYCADWR